MLPNSFDIYHKVIYIKYMELQKPGPFLIFGYSGDC